MWHWMDTELVEIPHDPSVPIGLRHAWWEIMVEKLLNADGVVSLC